MEKVKEALKQKAPENGYIIPDNDPIFLLIDVIEIWIHENNEALLSSIIQQSKQIESIEKRERLKQGKTLTDILKKIPLDLSENQKNTIKNQVLVAMDEIKESLKPKLWYKNPLFLLVSVNTFFNIAILLYFITL